MPSLRPGRVFRGRADFLVEGFEAGEVDVGARTGRRDHSGPRLGIVRKRAGRLLVGRREAFVVREGDVELLAQILERAAWAHFGKDALDAAIGVGGVADLHEDPGRLLPFQRLQRGKNSGSGLGGALDLLRVASGLHAVGGEDAKLVAETAGRGSGLRRGVRRGRGRGGGRQSRRASAPSEAREPFASGRRRLSRMLLTASRSRREGAGARASLEAAALEVAALETAAGAAGAGGSARRRPPVRAAATIAAPFSGAAPWGLREASFGWSWAFGEEGATAVRGVLVRLGCAAAGLRSEFGGGRRGRVRSGQEARLARAAESEGVGGSSGFGRIVRRGRSVRRSVSKGAIFERFVDLRGLASRRDLQPVRRPPVAKSRRVRRSTRPSGRRD